MPTKSPPRPPKDRSLRYHLIKSHVEEADAARVRAYIEESGIEGISYFEQMGFIMAMQASKPGQLVNLSFDDYLDWLAQFESEDLMTALGDIATLYRGQEVTNSEPKKEQG